MPAPYLCKSMPRKANDPEGPESVPPYVALIRTWERTSLNCFSAVSVLRRTRFRKPGIPAHRFVEFFVCNIGITIIRRLRGYLKYRQFPKSHQIGSGRIRLKLWYLLAVRPEADVTKRGERTGVARSEAGTLPKIF